MTKNRLKSDHPNGPPSKFNSNNIERLLCSQNMSFISFTSAIRKIRNTELGEPFRVGNIPGLSLLRLRASSRVRRSGAVRALGGRGFRLTPFAIREVKTFSQVQLEPVALHDLTIHGKSEYTAPEV